MTRRLKFAVLAVSILVGGTSLATPAAFAEPKPIHEPAYRLELVDQTLHVGKCAEISHADARNGPYAGTCRKGSF